MNMIALNINIFGELRNEDSKGIVQDLMNCNQKHTEYIVTFTIDSTGGSFSVYRKIKNALACIPKVKVKTICIGDAYSTAALIFTLGDERVMLGEDSRILFHEVGGNISGQYSDVKVAFENMEKDHADCISAISKVVKSMTPAKIEQKIKRDWMLSAKEAVELGVATSIQKDISNTY